jgi:hypothetical protein
LKDRPAVKPVAETCGTGVLCLGHHLRPSLHFLGDCGIFWWPGGRRERSRVLARPYLCLSRSLPRSFSSMSDITGNIPGDSGRSSWGGAVQSTRGPVLLLCPFPVTQCPWPGRKAAWEAPWEFDSGLHSVPGCTMECFSSCPLSPPQEAKGHPGALPAQSPGPVCNCSLQPVEASLVDPGLPASQTPDLHSASSGSVTLKPWSPGLSSSSSSDSVWPLGKPEGLLGWGCGLDLLNR